MTALRDAVAADLDAIVAVFLRCWRESYAVVLPPAVIDRMDEAAARAIWARALAAGGVVVADDSAVLGVTRYTTEGGIGHLASLYVSPDAQGRGIGRELLAEAERRMIVAGARSATLWVFRANEPSVGFYLRAGWVPDGTERVEEQFGAPELGLSKHLAP